MSISNAPTWITTGVESSRVVGEGQRRVVEHQGERGRHHENDAARRLVFKKGLCPALQGAGIFKRCNHVEISR